MKKSYPICAVIIMSLLCSCSVDDYKVHDPFEEEDQKIFESFYSNPDIGVISGDGIPLDVCFPTEGGIKLNCDKDGNILPQTNFFAAARADEYGSQYELLIVFRESPGKIIDNELEFVSGRVNADMYISYIYVPAHSPGFPADGQGGPANAYHVKVRLLGSTELHASDDGEYVKGEVKMIMVMENNDKFLFLFNELSMALHATFNYETFVDCFYTWPDFPQIRFREN